MNKTFIYLLIFIILIGCVVTQTETEDEAGITFTIYNETVHNINDMVFGQFMERAGHREPGPEAGLIPGTNQTQPRVVELLEWMNVPVFRFPGGSSLEARDQDWTEFIDNVPGREQPREKGKMFGYHEMLTLAEQLGSEMILVVSFRMGLWEEKPLEEAVMLAAGLVAYANAPVGAKLPEGMPDWPSVRAKNGHPEPFNVKYFQIGNEWPSFTKAMRKILGLEELDDQVKRAVMCAHAYIDGMKKVDPSIKIIIDGVVWPEKGEEFTKKFLSDTSITDKADYIAVHKYRPWRIKKILKDGERVWPKSLTAEELWNCMQSTPDINKEGVSVLEDPMIPFIREKGFKVAMTEWNWNGFGPGGSVLNSYYARGIGAACFLNALIRAGDYIEIGTQSMCVGTKWGINSIKADPENRIPAFMYPTGQVTGFYTRHHGDRMVKVLSRDIPFYRQPLEIGSITPKEKVALLDAVATANDEAVFVHIINRDFTNPHSVKISLNTFKTTGKAIHRIMEGRLHNKPRDGEANEMAWITEKALSFDADLLSIRLPERSVSIIEIPLKK